MKKQFVAIKPERGGWSEWQVPDDDSHAMTCNNCGFVHEAQFRTFAEVRQKADGFEMVPLPWPIRTMFRIKRRTLA